MVHPDYQQYGIGSRLLDTYISENLPSELITYTRSPAIIRMLSRVATSIYPLEYSEDARYKARLLSSDTSLEFGVTYQLERYPESGLFGGSDPADLSFDETGESLKERFPGLVSKRAALVVLATLNNRGL